MNRNFHKYTVEIQDTVFEHEDAPICKKTAILSFFDAEDKELDVIHLGYKPIEDIYKLIDNADSKTVLNLNYCYIKGFSLTDYRETRNLRKNKMIKLRGFSSRNSFFDSDSSIDFSYGDFISKDHDFSNTVFGNAVSFQSARFGDGEINFEYTLFTNGNVDFSNTRFGKGDISFKNSMFRKGDKSFERVDFNNGTVSFLNTEFGNGNLSFAYATFGAGDVIFKVARFGDNKKDFNHTVFGNGNVTFEKAEFGKGELNFRSAEFGEGAVEFTRSTFGKGPVNFTNTHFGKGDVSFVDTNFDQGKVSFKTAEFGPGKKDFHYSRFTKGDVIFDRSVFNDGLVDFRAVDFGEGKINFFRTEFGSGDIVFEATKLDSGRMNFKRASFGSGDINFATVEYENVELSFEEVNFGERTISFYMSRVGRLLLNACHINNYFDLRVQQCGLIDLSDSIVRDIIDITPHDFEVQIDRFDMSGMRLLGRIYIDWRANNVKNFIYQQDTNDRNRAEQFRVLKENYNATGKYNDEDEAYVEFKRTESKAFLKDAIDEAKQGLDDTRRYADATVINIKLEEYILDAVKAEKLVEAKKKSSNLFSVVRKSNNKLVENIQDSISKDDKVKNQLIKAIHLADKDLIHIVNRGCLDFVDSIKRTILIDAVNENITTEPARTELVNAINQNEDEFIKLLKKRNLVDVIKKTNLVQTANEIDLFEMMRKADSQFIAIIRKAIVADGIRKSIRNPNDERIITDALEQAQQFNPEDDNCLNEAVKHSNLIQALDKRSFGNKVIKYLQSTIKKTGGYIVFSLKKTWAHIRYWFQWLVFDKIGLYATDPVRVLVSMFFIYLFFTGVFYGLQFTSEIDPTSGWAKNDIISSLFNDAFDPRNLSRLGKAFYHSAITFLTIGYGDYYPSGVARWLSSVEGFIGLFLMSYFTVAFVRKILR